MENNKPQKKDAHQAWIAIQKYCAYQERCHQEVRSRLYDYGLHTEDVEEIIYQLIQENFINEERFAKAYVGGKFRVKKWGKQKILSELKRRKISDYCINKAFSLIEDEAYIETLNKVIERKERDYRSVKNDFERNQKIARYCYSRGFESDLIWEILKTRA